MPSPSREFDLRLAAVHRRQRLDERKPQPRAFLRAHMGAFGLFERLAQPLQIVLGDADAAVGDRDGDAHVAALDAQIDPAAARRELDGVGEQVDEDLLNRALVGEDVAAFARHRHGERDALAVGGDLHEAQRLAGDVLQIERLLAEIELAGLDLRHVENAVDEFEQMAARFVDQAGIFQIARRTDGPEHLVRHHFGEADDGVQGRAQLVAHIGEEARLGLVGLLGHVASVDQFALMGLALGDVARHRDDIGGPAFDRAAPGGSASPSRHRRRPRA